jgi:hypothetical protein
MKAVVGLGVLALMAAAAVGVAATSKDREVSKSLAPGDPLRQAEPFAVRELVESGDGTLRLADKAKRLSSRRVRMAGYMANLELPPRGGFYLTAHPVHGDESGAGTGDLPLDAVLVLSRSVGDAPIEPIAGPVEVMGILELGPQEDSEGRPNWIRLRLDQASSR